MNVLTFSVTSSRFLIPLKLIVFVTQKSCYHLLKFVVANTNFTMYASSWCTKRSWKHAAVVSFMKETGELLVREWIGLE